MHVMKKIMSCPGNRDRVHYFFCFPNVACMTLFPFLSLIMIRTLSSSFRHDDHNSWIISNILLSSLTQRTSLSGSHFRETMEYLPFGIFLICCVIIVLIFVSGIFISRFTLSRLYAGAMILLDTRYCTIKNRGGGRNSGQEHRIG